MLQKWKIILTNWIDCYFNETHKKGLPVNLESLLDIISHLRENLNLDESKSSLLDAHTVQEFMVEKYPDFKFGNGTVEPDSESDIYLAASLLLFFVCVNSKNVDIKSAMCSKLSPGDQEIILKFSKHLMECPKITNADVLTAIIEACGQDIEMAGPANMQALVAETPPALRSFHNEVRRLQAALDAERFDRTYLQEELTRTNLKVEKLLKDKEQYKLEIVDLKSQISMCCGQDRESRGEEVEANSTSKLVRQLAEMEQRLLRTQEQLEDVQNDRDTYKSKFNHLKSEHEQLVTFSQQESSRANSLAEELETEHRHAQSLQELVDELRQHNHLNRIDSSLLECDDPDASINSLQHNSSATSELCANVIEVQLGEERLKIVALKQQIQILQEQLCDVTKKAEEEKQSFTKIITGMESTIMDLKHRVNEEIEDKNTLKTIFDNDVAKLNNEINELEQRLKGSQENSRNIIEKKMQEIQNLQEEKMSLLQSLSDETTKLENIIKDLQYEVDAEKSSKIKLREEYDTHIMKLNEKVLNRNNELVELQNKIVSKGEMIEHLQLELRREKELRDDISNKHNNELMQLNSRRQQLEQSLQQKSEMAKDLHNDLQHHVSFIEQMNKEIDHLKATVGQLQKDCEILKDTKEKLLVEIKNRDVKAEQIYKETENLNNLLFEEKQKLQHNLEESSVTINTLQVQLQNEIQFKVEMQHKLQNSEDQNSKLSVEISKLNANIQKLSEEKGETKKLLSILEDKLTEEKRSSEILKHELQDVNSRMEQLTQEVIENNKIIKDVKDELESRQKAYNESLSEKDKIIESNERKFKVENENLEKLLLCLQNEKDKLLNILNEKEKKLMQIQSEYNAILKSNADHKQALQTLQENILEKSEECTQLKQKYDSEITKLLSRLDETEKSLKEIMEKSNNVIEGKEFLIQTLNIRAEQFERMNKDMQENLLKSETEKQSLNQQISAEKSCRSNVEKEYLNQYSVMKNVIEQLNEEILKKNEEIHSLKVEIQSTLNTTTEKDEEIKLLEWNLTQTSQNLKDITQHRDKEVKLLHINMMEMEQSYKDAVKELNKEIQRKLQVITMLEAENTDLRNNTADVLKDKNSTIIDLQQKLEATAKQLDSSQKSFENEKVIWENCKVDMEMNILEKDSMIQDFTSQISALNQLVEESKRNEVLLNEKDILIQELLDEKSTNQALICERNKIEQQLEKEIGIREIIAQEKECITQQFFEERLAKQVAEQEKHNLALTKEEIQGKIEALLDEKNSLEQQINDIRAVQTVLEEDKKKLFSETNQLCLEKNNLTIENQTLKKDLEDFKDHVNELQNEKLALTIELHKLNEMYLGQLKDKQDEMQLVTSDYDSLKSDFKKLEESMVEGSSVLVHSLQHFIDILMKEEIFSEAFRELLVVEKNSKMTISNRCDFINKLLISLGEELAAWKKVNMRLKDEHSSLMEVVTRQKLQISQLQTDIQNGQQLIQQQKVDSATLKESYILVLESKNRDVLTLQNENQSLHNELNDVKIQLDCKVHSLKDKLTDNENVTDKLRKTYDCQIDNLNMMVNKLTTYLKEKTVELDNNRTEKDKLQKIVDDNTELMKSLKEEIKSVKQEQEKLLCDFESERLVLKNMITVTESVMDDQRISLNKVISENLKAIEALQEENKMMKLSFDEETKNNKTLIKVKELAIDTALHEISELKRERDTLTSQIQELTKDLNKYKEEIKVKTEEVEKLTNDSKELNNLIIKYKNDMATIEKSNNEWKIKKDIAEVEFTNEIEKLKKELSEKSDDNKKLESVLQEKIQHLNETQATVKILNDRISDLDKRNLDLEFEKNECVTRLEEIKTSLEATVQIENNEYAKLKNEYQNLLVLIEDKKSEIIKLESLLMFEKEQNKLLQDDNNNEKQNLTHKCGLLQEYQYKAEQELERREKEIEVFKKLAEKCENNLRDRDEYISQLRQEKDALITKLSKELIEERETCLKEVESQKTTIHELKRKLEDVTRSETDTVKLLRKENEVLRKTLALRESFAAASQEKSSLKGASQGVDVREQLQQVDNASSDHTHSSLESYKTISDLEKILQDRNRTITSLQSDITYLKSLMAESENKLLDVTKDLEVNKENCQLLSSQLKKIVHQKNEEIADLKRQLARMSVTENRASQIIKVSAKYQAMILKRIAEIKTNTVLKELTNFGNTANCDNELRRSLTAGSVTMEDLENFLDTTDRHLKRCSEKQLALQKERDRLIEVNRINESEIINMKKFLTELSVIIKTFNAVKEVYTQKLSRVVSLQRTVRREILSLDERVTDAAMCKLERGYAAVMQDLSECAMNLQRWVERSISRSISVEKIKQALSNEERSSLAPATFQNASLEVQLEELENSFCKLLEEVARAQKGEGAKDAQAVTVMEVRAEYEDKLNRMKAKMKQLYQEQIGIFKEKQREEIASLERELQQAREKLEESSRAYEEHIRSLTTELWSVGEKFLMKKDEAEWLRRKQRSGSLMSLQHVHSSGLVPTQEEPSRPSDTHSLRSLPVTNSNNNNNNNNKAEGRGLHMSDEEGEVFDNRCLRELASTPARAPARRATRDARDAPPGQRLSELQWRNSLCPPHLKSSYPAETQFVSAVHEEDIKCMGGPSMSLGGVGGTGVRAQRKEVGITAYKKPGPPTPSKQAGRLSATDSELRESLRVEAEPNGSRKTSTPSRIRALFRSSKADNVEGTPRSRRLSNIFRKK